MRKEKGVTVRTTLFSCILWCSREILDHQDGNIEDDGLTGLLRLATSVIKHKPPFKFSREGQVGIKTSNVYMKFDWNFCCLWICEIFLNMQTLKNLLELYWWLEK